MILRFLGYAAFVATKAAAACPRDAGLDNAAAPTLKCDRATIREQFNARAKEPSAAIGADFQAECGLGLAVLACVLATLRRGSPREPPSSAPRRFGGSRTSRLFSDRA
jgi:hypothetical protein